MDARLTSTLGVWRLVAAFVALVLVVAIGVTPASASSTSCRVQSTDTGKIFIALQAAIDAAKRGDRLTVRGICVGKTAIDRYLVIEGIRTAETRPLLAGDHRGIVLTVRKGARVKVTDLAIEGGRGHFRKGGPEKPYNWPAGVLNHGNLTLRSVIVKENRGIGIENTGRLRLNGDSIVRDNGFESVNKHKGIHNTGTLRLNGTASVRWDDVENDGTLVMNGTSSVTDLINRGTVNLNADSLVHSASNRGTLALNDTAQVVGCFYCGTAFYNHGTLTLNDASGIVHGDTGVFNASAATMVMNGRSFISGHDWVGVRNLGTLVLNGSATITENHHLDPGREGCGVCFHAPLEGGGVHNSGSLILNDSSSITSNSVQAWTEGSYGGGVYMVRDRSLSEPPSLTLTGSATVSGNSADRGGGVYVGAGSVLNGVMCGTQTGANVYGNTPDDCHVESP